MKERKKIKSQAKTCLKRHWFIFVAGCLIAAFLGSEFSGALGFSSARSLGVTGQSSVPKTQVTENSWEGILATIAQNDLQAGRDAADRAQQAAVEAAQKGDPAFGRTRGVLSEVVNQITSGSIVVTAVAAAASITGSESGGVALLVVVFALGLAVFWFFIQNVFPVVMRRVFLEGMLYDRVTPQRFLFLIRVRRWRRAAWTMCVKYVLYLLWCLTVVGGVVKHYSYFLVPYIVAENPDMTARQAIGLSRRMMQGHKWECFVFELSFIGWDVLGILTLGLSDVLFTNPYKMACFTRYYARLRALAIQNGLQDAKLLDDDYLYEKAPADAIAKKYSDVIRVMNTPDGEQHRLSGWRGVLADDFGVLLFPREQDRVAEARRADRVRLFALMDDVEGTAYPVRLYPLPEEERQKLVESLNYMRRYSVWSLLAIFLSLSVFGWLWEVGLHLVSTGELVNRGVLHGPWLPIYGTGAVLMLTVLYRLRGRPGLEFLATILLCGTLEYMTSLVLELATGGTLWWDYSGYFLNLNGRICAEGLLVFGVGGLAVVYMAAPLLDAALARVDRKLLVTVCSVVAAVFFCDAVWSQFEPNTGRGVTDIEGGRPASGYVQQAES